MKSYDLQTGSGSVNLGYEGSLSSKEEQVDKETEKDAEVSLDDAWQIQNSGPPWKELTTKEKAARVSINTIKVLTVFVLLYFFICSLDLLSSAFKLISGQSTSNLVDNEFINNPIVGLMVGILLTVLVQSSSTSTSIVVSMVSAGLLSVNEAIPIIMGTNIGTSVTNTIVSLTQAGDREQFRRAFSGATVHDMFNWLTVIVMLPLEVAFGLLEKLTGAIVDSVAKADGAQVVLLKAITEPFTDLIIQLDTFIIDCWSLNLLLDKKSIITEYCEYNSSSILETTPAPTTDTFSSPEPGNITADDLCSEDVFDLGVEDSCHFLFYQTTLSDATVGIILLALSLFILCSALIIIVKLLNSMLKGSIAVVIKKTLNADIPYMPWLTGYIAILIGAVLTFIVQSSSIFTSTLTPLIGIGIITVERAYPLTLGSNIGTTTTALLASLAGEGEGLINAVQVALVHLFFNIFGILIFYPIPFMRFPIPMCKALGKTTAQYRWFAVVYLIFMFFLMPVLIFLLSMGGPVVFWSVMGPVIILLLFVVLVNILQNKRPSFLPAPLRNWEFLPLPLRSLQPYDRAATSFPCCKSCRNHSEDEEASLSSRPSGSIARDSRHSSTPDFGSHSQRASVAESAMGSN